MPVRRRPTRRPIRLPDPSPAPAASPALSRAELAVRFVNGHLGYLGGTLPGDYTNFDPLAKSPRVGLALAAALENALGVIADEFATPRD